MSHPNKTNTDPIPILSKKNVKLVEKIIDEKNIDIIIETEVDLHPNILKKN
mgnify:CR=1 FL=1